MYHFTQTTVSFSQGLKFDLLHAFYTVFSISYLGLFFFFLRLAKGSLSDAAPAFLQLLVLSE